jgi:hypothetical protein
MHLSYPATQYVIIAPTGKLAHVSGTKRLSTMSNLELSRPVLTPLTAICTSPRCGGEDSRWAEQPSAGTVPVPRPSVRGLGIDASSIILGLAGWLAGGAGKESRQTYTQSRGSLGGPSRPDNALL